MKIIDTESLRLRPFTPSDIEDVHREIYSDPEVVRWYSGGGVLTPDQTREHVLRHLSQWTGDLGRHAVVRRSDGAFLGQVHLNAELDQHHWWRRPDEPPFNSVEVELAMAFGRRWWGAGCAFEACEAMVRYAFGDLNLARLVNVVRVENVRSQRLHERLGYSRHDSPDPKDAFVIYVLENR